MDTKLQEERQFQFTPGHKLHALALRFYHGQNDWQPKVGDFYTLTRSGIELLQVVRIEDGQVYISNCLNGLGQEQGPFPLDGFTTEGFGVNRVQVPDFIFDLPAAV